MVSDAPSTDELIVCDDPRTGLRAFIAIDDTTLGPALGGVRFKAYADDADAALEARRLAAGMTLKNAAAELPYGGGKSVIVARGPVRDRTALMRAFGGFVARTGGRYLPGVDMGTTVADMAEIGRVAEVACDVDDPSRWTALGVWAGIRAAVEQVDGAADLRGVTVAIQGVGNVGADLARRVAAEGASVLVADIDDERAHRVAREVGGAVVPNELIATVRCDVFAPCAAARVVTRENVAALGARIVAGAANDVLAEPVLAEDLAGRGITYVPDFLINAGGVVHIHALRVGWSPANLRAAVLAIGDRVGRTLTSASATGNTPTAMAVSAALGRIAAGHDHADLAA